MAEQQQVRMQTLPRQRALFNTGVETTRFPMVCAVWNDDEVENWWTGTYLGVGPNGAPAVLTCRHGSTQAADVYRVALPVAFAQEITAEVTFAVEEIVRHDKADVAVFFLKSEPGVAGFPAGALARNADFAAIRAAAAAFALTFCGFGTRADGNGAGAKRAATGANLRLDRPVAIAEDLEFIAGGRQNGGVHDVCEGDSGGPVFVTVHGQEKLLGVVSRSVGPLCGPDGGIFVRVDAVQEWIREKMKQPLTQAAGVR